MVRLASELYLNVPWLPAFMICVHDLQSGMASLTYQLCWV